MALFKRKKESTNKEKSSATAEKKQPESVSDEGGGEKSGADHSAVLLRPHVTEKATDLSGRGVYAFEIDQRANKTEVRVAVEKLYKVKPIRGNVVNQKPKLMKNPRTGRVQTKQSGMKKALVYLKSGDKIEFV